MRKRSYLWLLCLLSPLAYSGQAAHKIEKTLLTVQHKIKKAEKNIYHYRHQEALLTKQLSKTEKEIGEKAEQVYQLQKTQKQHEQSLVALNTQLTELKQHYQKQHTSLKKLILATFHSYHQEKSTFLANQFFSSGRLEQYYQFFYQARAKQLAQLQKDLQQVHTLQAEIESMHDHTQKVCQKAQKAQAQLNQQKEKRARLLLQLSRQIKQDQGILLQLQKQEQHLAQLFAALKKERKASTLEGFALKKAILPLKAISTPSQKNHFPAQTHTPVMAIAQGQVVFAEWLRGIGLLLIIDHGQGYMSLYGNNQKLYKALGETVKQGEIVARVGQSGGYAQPGLYFEVRKDGKALDLTSWFSGN